MFHQSVAVWIPKSANYNSLNQFLNAVSGANSVGSLGEGSATAAGIALKTTAKAYTDNDLLWSDLIDGNIKAIWTNSPGDDIASDVKLLDYNVGLATSTSFFRKSATCPANTLKISGSIFLIVSSHVLFLFF